jgi:peptide/nickel transport system substrate-binding protein
MRTKHARRFAIAGILAATVMATAASADTFRWAGQTDPQTLDPHAVNTAPVLGFLNNIYDGLVRRGKDMKIGPSLAVRWEPLGADGWRFHLRQGVTFAGGETFDSDDVLFSYQRASSEAADVRAWFAPVSEVKVVDKYTIDFLTKAPNPLFPDSIANFMIMDKGWAEANNAALPSRDQENYATRNANGTSAFKIASRDPDVRTVVVPNPNYWETPEHNITEGIFTPITAAPTRVAALLSGEIDFVEPIPLQDVPRLKSASGLTVHEGVEARVIMLGFEHTERAPYNSDAGKNPFTDKRVRQAVYQAIDVDAIIAKTMRGNAQAAGLLITPAIRGFKDEFNSRLPFDVDGAKALLTDAGYPDGFSFGLRCPNDRYINDEAICSAVTSMLAKIGITAKLETVPVRNYWPELREDKFDMYLLGWSSGTFDAEHPIRFLVHTPNKEKRLGSWNFGKYSNARVDDLLPQIQVELDDAKRQSMLDEVHTIMRDEVAYVPLHVQPLVWASKSNVSLTQRADNFFILRWVTVN